MVYNFKCLEKVTSVISGFGNLLALFLLKKVIFCKNLVIKILYQNIEDASIIPAFISVVDEGKYIN